MTTQPATRTQPATPPPVEPPLDEPLLTLMGLVFESASGAGEVLTRSFPVHGALTPQLFEPLLRLSRTEGGRLRMTDLSAQCQYSASAVTRVADRLEELGWAERQSCPTDRRVIHLAITAEGRRQVSDLMPDHLRLIDRDVFGSLGADERAELERLLRKVRDRVHPWAASVSAHEVR